MGCAASKKVATEPQQPISISDFTICYRIGNSPNAYVTLAEKGNKYCIKYVYKNNKNKPEALVNAIAERNFLAALHHPFIVPLRYAFQDDQYYFIVCDFYEAGDLRGVMDSMDFTEQQIRFIGAELVLALEYLHSLEVVHRDIKPDNIFMSIHGHVYLSDFELAFGATKPIRANSGTEAYMAPEMHQNHGHSLPVDIWALGVTFFELYFRNRPFRTQKKKELIIAGTFTFPTTKTISNDFKRLIERMLQVDPLERPLIKGVKYHPFFQNVKWTQIFQKSVQSPITPPQRTGSGQDAELATHAALHHKKSRSSRLPNAFKYYNHETMAKHRTDHKLLQEQKAQSSSKLSLAQATFSGVFSIVTGSGLSVEASEERPISRIQSRQRSYSNNEQRQLRPPKRSVTSKSQTHQHLDFLLR